MKDPIRVLIVEDSPLIGDILISMFQNAPGFRVIGQARNGLEAVELTARLRPDVITMDIRMPHLNGLEATRQIMSRTPTPIVILTSSVYSSDLNIAFNAVTAGALTVVEKPKGLSPVEYEQTRQQLLTTVGLMADVAVVTRHPRPAAGAAPLDGSATLPANDVKLIAVAASTGGPQALNQMLCRLPGDLPVPILVVQHITTGFASGFAHWLNGVTPLGVSVAQQGERVTAGHVYLAPDDTHLTITPGGIIQLDRSEPVKGHRPSATWLFESAAKTYGAKTVGVILTGMGDDGVDGLVKLRQAGGRVIAQSEDSCVVFGMPKVAIERGLAHDILPPDDIGRMVQRMVMRQPATRDQTLDVEQARPPRAESPGAG